jgi:uncharacterized phage protein (TIGR02220 family)
MIHSLKEDGRPATQWYWDDWFSSHDVQSCSLAAQGLWVNLLGIMFSSEIRGTLTINGMPVDNKIIAKRFGHHLKDVNKLITELEAAKVFSRLEDGTIYSRRMYRESLRQQEISQKRAEAGKAGMAKRWGEEDNKVITSPYNKTITKITASSSTPSSSPTSTPSSIKKEEVSSIVSYLNEKAGKNFSDKSENTIHLISGRLSEGRTVEDFKKVIDVKAEKWRGKTWKDRSGDTVCGDDYLRPSTLFSKTNFENYLNETSTTKSADDIQEWVKKTKADQLARGDLDD